MKLIIRQYLAGLRERNELDAVLPDLLSQMGLTVYSRPGRGTRQDGVDVGAVGSIDGGPEKVYVFSIKSGDLSRKEWDGDTVQSLRPSLNEIIDAYIPNRLPPEHKDKEVVICPTFGGDVQEQVRTQFNGFMTQNSKPGRISFEEWNGDKLANLIQSHLLREDLIGEGSRSDLRKTLALLDEPDTSYEYFASLVRGIESACTKDEERVRGLRQLSVCLWILFSWSRDADNLECAYRASELALLHGWNICRAFAGKKTKLNEAATASFMAIFQVYRQITSTYLAKIAPHLQSEHALSSAVRGGSPIDVNLKLFDLLGRVSIAGIWTFNGLLVMAEESPDRQRLFEEVLAAINAIDLLVKTNPTLNSPLKDDQAIEIGLAACLLFFNDDGRDVLRSWLPEMLRRIRFAFAANEKYPSILGSYSELMDHPVSGEPKYRENATSAAILYPVIAHVATILEDDAIFQSVSDLQNEFLQHTNFQLWFPDDASEENLYTNKDLHGIALTDIKLQGGRGAFKEMIAAEIAQFPQTFELSCVKNGWWPLILVACRHFRLPVPPKLLQLYVEKPDPEASAISSKATPATSSEEYR
jgi:hypothetical protein